MNPTSGTETMFPPHPLGTWMMVIPLPAGAGRGLLGLPSSALAVLK